MTTAHVLVADDPAISALVGLVPQADTTAIVVGTRAVAAAVAATAGVTAVTRLGEPGAEPLEAWARAVADLVARDRPDVVLASTRPADRALAGAVAARLGAPILTMVTGLTPGSGWVDVTQTVNGGIAQRTVRVTGPVVVVVDGGPAASDDGTGGPAVVTEVSAEPLGGTSVVETRPATHAQVDLSRAPRIVAVGRGVKAREDLAMVDQLAGALGAEVACSRPLAEGAGWFTHDRYIGVTGQHVSPDLYVALGISGQLQHTAGAREAGTVVVVNTDANAPYAKEADYVVVGDLYQVVPALIEALR